MIEKQNWKLTDNYELGLEFECPYCQAHVDVSRREELPNYCPCCFKEVGVSNE